MRRYAIRVMLMAAVVSFAAGCDKGQKEAEVPAPSIQSRTGGLNVDREKKIALIESISAQPECPLVAIERFFDGNNDLGSIGCNLMEHPGIDQFHEILTGLLRRDDVEAVFVQISELDPGDECWPFSDTVLVVGTIPVSELLEVVAPLQPDEVGTTEEYGTASSVLTKYKSPVHVIWWD